MKSNERDVIFYLEDILLAMKRIQEYVKGLDFQGFKWDYKTVDAVIRNFEIIGEASKNVLSEIKDQYGNIPWDEMYRLRNRVSHEYFGIDYGIIWEICTRHLPINLKDIKVILVNEKSKNR